MGLLTELMLAGATIREYVRGYGTGRGAGCGTGRGRGFGFGKGDAKREVVTWRY